MDMRRLGIIKSWVDCKLTIKGLLMEDPWNEYMMSRMTCELCLVDVVYLELDESLLLFYSNCTTYTVFPDQNDKRPTWKSML